jgi:UDP-glucuronate 4-epimerase
MKTYLITGASGFIGSHLAESLLKDGNKIINVDNFNDYYDLNLKIENVLNIMKN